VGSQVTLYAAGQSAYKTGATALGSAVTDSRGRFTIEFPPSATPELLYVVALGGNAGAGSNSAIGLMGVVGPSNAPEDPVTINELTTIAGEWAMAQFIDSTGQQAGAPRSNSAGIFNAAQQAVQNLADTTTGTPAAFLPTALDCSGGLPPVNCDGLERLNTLADIIAACVQSTGPSATLPSCTTASRACDILFACTRSPADATTLEAANAIATNPTQNVSNLFNAAGSAGPYQPSLISTPDGFEIAVNIFPLGANLSFPVDIEADFAGNLWIANLGGDSVTELDPIGRWLGTFAPTGAEFNEPYSIAIDGTNHIWISDSNGSDLTELDASGNLIANRSPAGAKISDPNGIEIDAGGNVWVANEGNNSVGELLKSSGYSTGLNFAPENAFFNKPIRIAIDTDANVWVTNFFGNSVSELIASSGYKNGSNFAPTEADFSYPVGLALDDSNNVWVTNFYLGTNISELPAADYSNGLSFSPTAAQLDRPALLKLDSAGNIWTVNYGSSTLSELQAGCTSVSCTGLNFDPEGANLNSPYGVTVDAAGNIWIASAGNNTIAEFIGLGAPTAVSALCLADRKPSSCLP
jgi:streptogramin lyase